VVSCSMTLVIIYSLCEHSISRYNVRKTLASFAKYWWY